MRHGEQCGADGVQPNEVAGSCPVSQPVSRAVRGWIEDHLRIMQRSRRSCRQVGHTPGVGLKHQPKAATCLLETWSWHRLSTELMTGAYTETMQLTCVVTNLSYVQGSCGARCFAGSPACQADSSPTCSTPQSQNWLCLSGAGTRCSCMQRLASESGSNAYALRTQESAICMTLKAVAL